jgi:predicted RND superfamily exporter protein
VRLERLLRLAYEHRGRVMAAAGLVLAVSILLLTRLSFETNVLKLLPQSGPAIRAFDAYLERFGTLDHLYVLFETPKGRIADHEEFVDSYVRHLRTLPDIQSVDAALFDEVKDWGYLFDRELLLLGADDARAALQRFDPATVRSELARSRGMLAMGSPEVKAYV